MANDVDSAPASRDLEKSLYTLESHSSSVKQESQMGVFLGANL